ncbi:MAG TPA: nucleotide exchange factor GrpE [Terracidiphilus sp.]|nr:nucleotide exchange factor GrpE [Terracidiphilus sp.]
MPEQEMELNVLEPLEIAEGKQTEEADASVVAAEAVDETGSAAKPAQTEAAETAQAETSELDKVKAERDQLLDRVARMQAEFENARKRGERERNEFREFAAANVVEQFLPVLDNFQLALKAQGSAEQMRSGVELIVKQMEEILRQMQVVPVAAVGEEFDPRVHEALGTVDRDDIPDQHVAEEVRRGYKMRERLLRPALVRIAHNAKQVNE